jgi:thioredoxin 1
VSEHTQPTSDTTFRKDVLESSLPVLVDFWAEWCGPCRAVAPVVDEVAQAYEGRLKVLKLNVDESPQTPSAYNIRSIPTLMLFKDGKVQGTKVGALSKQQLTAFLDINL